MGYISTLQGCMCSRAEVPGGRDAPANHRQPKAHSKCATGGSTYAHDVPQFQWQNLTHPATHCPSKPQNLYQDHTLSDILVQQIVQPAHTRVDTLLQK
jgi:hypothetical protein